MSAADVLEQGRVLYRNGDLIQGEIFPLVLIYIHANTLLQLELRSHKQLA